MSATTATQQPHIPEVFILWHPNCSIGQTIASRIYGWLRPGAHGLGPDVYYRCLPAPDRGAGGLPLDLPVPGHKPDWKRRPANFQIIIILIDANMVADYAWRSWLGEIARHSSANRRAFFPVALDSTSFNAPAIVGRRNFFRPVGLPLVDMTEPARSQALELAVRSLLKQLTESLCTLLLLSPPSSSAGDEMAPRVAPKAAIKGAAAAKRRVAARRATPADNGNGVSGGETKLAIFLSHAKADGTSPARRIRNFIYANTQVGAFFDENDIPYGSDFGQVLDLRLRSASTAAFIAVQTAAYARRPWCRRELSIFRRPRPEKPADTTAEQWKLHPIVVVNALEGGAQTASIPEIGNATQIRWSDQYEDQEEQIVTTVLRDALLAAFHTALGRSLATDPRCIVINWLPDPLTLLHIDRVRNRGTPVEVLYPGGGMTGLELDILNELFPDVTFRSFDQVLL